jgi:hypothetical protein
VKKQNTEDSKYATEDKGEQRTASYIRRYQFNAGGRGGWRDLLLMNTYALPRREDVMCLSYLDVEVETETARTECRVRDNMDIAAKCIQGR